CKRVRVYRPHSRWRSRKDNRETKFHRFRTVRYIGSGAIPGDENLNRFSKKIVSAPVRDARPALPITSLPYRPRNKNP
ncbi:MAG TPA: hypothetical protein VFW53_01450, partial [Gallionella sp.]|nr:hypothetical protein [Gallionella sp.]